MINKFKLGQILCDRSSLKSHANHRFYYLVIQEESRDNYMVIQPINSNPNFISGASINPLHPEQDLIVTELKASYLLHQEITVMESFFNQPVTSEAIGFEGIDRVIKFTPVNGDLVGNVYYEIKCPKKQIMSGYLFFDFHHKQKFIKKQ